MLHPYPGSVDYCISLTIYLPVIIKKHDQLDEITLQFIELCSQEESLSKGNANVYLKKLKKIFQRKKLTGIGSKLQKLLKKINKDINSDRNKKISDWVEVLNTSIQVFIDKKEKDISDYSLRWAKKNIVKITKNPAHTIIKEAIEYRKKRGYKISSSTNIPPHNLKFPGQYYSIRQTVYISILLILRANQNKNIEICFSVLKSPQKDRLIISIETSGVEGLEKILMPISTRLRALGTNGSIAANNPNQFKILLPIIRL